MPPLLVARDLSKAYLAGHGRCWARVQVLAALSLTLYRGERLLILGGHGSGKTTLLHCLTGLRRPDAGSVRWDASRGAPYRLCPDPATLRAGSRAVAALVELPADTPAASQWLEALHDQPRAGWLVLASRPGALPLLAHRVLELYEGSLRSVTSAHPLRVAEAP